MWGGDYITYERETLYQQVWAEPLRTVAKSYGVSDVYLGKICRQLSVPLPGRGYWAKVRAGKSPRRPRLPKLKKGAPERVGFWHRHQEPRKRLEVSEEAKVSLAAPIVVADALSEPHKLVARTERRLRRAKPRYGLVKGRWLEVLDVSVSPESLDRALRIFDALLKGIEAAGLRVEITGSAEVDKDTWGYDRNQHLNRVTRILCDEEWITVALWEEVRRTEDPKPEPAPRRSAWGGTYTPWQETTYTYTPTGSLALQMTNIAGMGTRAMWKDGKRQRLEDCVAPFIAHLGIAAQALKADRAEKERVRLEREEEHRRWEEAEARRWEEQRRLERLTKEASAWHQASQLRDFAQEGLRRLQALEALSEADEARREELEWLLAYADQIDPLRG